MTTKNIDGIKPEPKTELEAWQRWLNRLQSEMLTRPFHKRKVIQVKYVQS